MEKSGEKMMMKKKEKETEVGESSATTSISNIWGSSWEFVEQGITTPLLNLFSYFFTTKTTTTTQPTTTKLSPPPTKSTVISLSTLFLCIKVIDRSSSNMGALRIYSNFHPFESSHVHA